MGCRELLYCLIESIASAQCSATAPSFAHRAAAIGSGGPPLLQCAQWALSVQLMEWIIAGIYDLARGIYAAGEVRHAGDKQLRRGAPQHESTWIMLLNSRSDARRELRF